MEFNQELLELAKSASRIEALRIMVKAKGIKWSEEEAKSAFARVHTAGELTDDALSHVASGADLGSLPPGGLIHPTSFDDEKFRLP